MASEDPVQQAMLAAIPHLRAFAISLTGSIEQADDLVQTALLRGLENLDKFQPGTSMQAWLFTILRNQFHTIPTTASVGARWRIRTDPWLSEWR
jgi:RNA polymerase sigma-70 factor, ECF subfamily